MKPSARHAFIIALRDLGELWHERATMIVCAIFTFAFPSYLGWMAATIHLNPTHVLIWALDCSMMPIFPAAMMMVHTFIAERDQGILPTLLATPVSNLALFTGKAVPIIMLGISQGLGAYATYCLTIYFRNREVILAADRVGLIVLPLMLVCTTLLVSGAGIIIASRVRAIRTAALALTFCSLFILSAEFGVALWLMLDPLGHELALDAIISHTCLGVATLTVAANTYRREQIVAQL